MSASFIVAPARPDLSDWLDEPPHEVALRYMQDAVALWDPDLCLRFASAQFAQLLALPDEFVRPGTTMEEVMRFQAARGDFGPPPADAADMDVFVRDRLAILRSGDGMRYDRASPDGRWLEISVAPLEVGGHIIVYRDITTLKHQEAELARARDEAERARDTAEAAGRAKASFLATMSHEIRTPMNGVLGMLDVLEQGGGLSADQARCLSVMRGSAGALLRIIDDILDFSKIEEGRLELEEQPFSLSCLISEIAETFGPAAGRKGLRLICQPLRSPDLLVGDPVRVRQILTNLVGNAVKFTHEGYVLVAPEIRADATGGATITLVVEDSGIGLTAEQVSRLFQPFVQADGSTTRRYGGSGLGLSIVRRLARMMGGDVSVESESGRGSRFMVTLRLQVGAPANVGPSRFEPPPRPRSPEVRAAPRLLIADDHPVNREVLLRQLALLGFEADAAEDGAQALTLWRTHRYPVILLDLHMPQLDGTEVASAIRAEEAGGAVRCGIIAVTASALSGDEQHCLAAGMDDFVPKPVVLETLSRVLGRFVPN